jgi:hypothetical protein
MRSFFAIEMTGGRAPSIRCYVSSRSLMPDSQRNQQTNISLSE